MKKCSICGQDAHFYWNKKSTGEKLKLCATHYEEMERTVHQKEKNSRMVSATTGVITGNEIAKTECPNGENCKYCKELGLTQ